MNQPFLPINTNQDVPQTTIFEGSMKEESIKDFSIQTSKTPISKKQNNLPTVIFLGSGTSRIYDNLITVTIKPPKEQNEKRVKLGFETAPYIEEFIQNHKEIQFIIIDIFHYATRQTLYSLISIGFRYIYLLSKQEKDTTYLMFTTWTLIFNQLLEKTIQEPLLKISENNNLIYLCSCGNKSIDKENQKEWRFPVYVKSDIKINVDNQSDDKRFDGDLYHEEGISSTVATCNLIVKLALYASNHLDATARDLLSGMKTVEFQVSQKKDVLETIPPRRIETKKAHSSLLSFNGAEAPQSRGKKKYIVLWVDDNPSNNNEFIEKMYPSIQLEQSTSTYEAIKFLEENQDLIKNENTYLRIITDTLRPEQDDHGRLVYKDNQVVDDPKAGEKLIQRLLAMGYEQHTIKMIHSRTDPSEINSFLRFDPEYISMDHTSFSQEKSKLYFNTLIPSQESEEMGGRELKTIILKELNSVLKRTLNVNMNVIEIKHYYKRSLLGEHKKLYEEFNKNTKEVVSDTLCFYHANETEFSNVFSNGLNTKSKYHLTTNPQNVVDTMSLKAGETKKMIGGFAILGKTVKLDSRNDSHLDSPINDSNSHISSFKDLSLDSFDVTIFDQRQFLPCFEITLQKTQ